jgi:hypothetical protein
MAFTYKDHMIKPPKEAKAHHPFHWKEKGNIYMKLMVHETLDDRSIFWFEHDLADTIFEFFDPIQLGIIQTEVDRFYRYNRLRDGSCPILWYTVGKDKCIIRFGTHIDVRIALEKFVRNANEHSIIIYSCADTVSSKAAMYFLGSVKQNFKRICAFNQMHGNGYKLFPYNLC